MTMSSDEFVEAVRERAKVGQGYLVTKTRDFQGNYDMAQVAFYNVPQDVGRGGGGAVAMNNRLLLFVKGFGREQGATPPTGKVKLEVGAAELLPRGQRPRGKTATPEKMVGYVAKVISDAAKMEPRVGNPQSALRFPMRKYGLSAQEAEELVGTPDFEEILDAHEGWLLKHGAAAGSPISRGQLMDEVRRARGRRGPVFEVRSAEGHEGVFRSRKDAQAYADRLRGSLGENARVIEHASLADVRIRRLPNDAASFGIGAAAGAGALILSNIVRGSPGVRYVDLIDKAQKQADAGNFGEAQRTLQKADAARAKAVSQAGGLNDNIELGDQARGPLAQRIERGIRSGAREAVANPVVTEAELTRRLKF